ncbi:MAG: T9SS type B sorting domain-containing protein, partial [Bacteroidota bacterium]
GEALLCFGDADGDIDLTVSGGTLPYTYQWDNGAGTDEDPSGLTVGDYAVTVTDNNGCIVESSASITQPTELIASATGEALLCFGDADGTIDLTVSGGSQPYTYEWDNGAGTDEDPGDLIAGDYAVTVTDNNGCTIESSASITQPNELLAITVGETLLCFGANNGDIDLTVSGGSQPYTYQWNNGAGDNEDPSGLTAGDYTVTVTDNNGCSITSSASVLQPDLLTAIAVGEELNCFGDADGDIELTVSGGIEPYTYQWDNGAGTNEDPSGLSVGNYAVTILDNNGCVLITSTSITEPDLLTLQVDNIVDLDCNGDADGQATAIVDGGTLPYTYQWDNGETTASAIALNGGAHSVTIIDANNCSVDANLNIDEPALLQISVSSTPLTCFEENDGSMTATLTGGTQPYTYEWNNGGTVFNPSGLPAGLYTITATDANGCEVIESIDVTQPDELLVSFQAVSVTCFGFDDGQASATVSGGTQPYTYVWDNGETTPIATNLDAGIHDLSITDGNGCLLVEQVQVGSPTELIFGNVPLSVVNVQCFGDNTGSVIINPQGGTQPYTFQWSNGQTNQVATDLPAGTYDVTVTDNNGCFIASNEFEVTQPEGPLAVSFEVMNITCFGDSDGSIQATVSGGTPTYNLNWSNGGIESGLINLSAGDYVLTITDENNCSLIDTVTIVQPDPIMGEVIIEEPTCFGEFSGTITVDTSSMIGGTPPYIYSLDGFNYQANERFVGVGAGVYTLQIEDSEGCMGEIQVIVDQPDEIIVNLEDDLSISLGEEATLIPDISTEDTLTYSWNPPQYLSCTDCPNPTILPLETTTYTLVVTNQAGCSASDEITVRVNKDRNIYIPNAFTPNNDGINDLFMIFGGLGVVEVQEFRIYDRWGEQIIALQNFMTDDPNFGWDGSFKGQLMNPGVFVYYADVLFIDGEVVQFKGDVTLIR